MRLDLGCIHIEDVRFGAKTAIENHALSIDRRELTSLLEEEPLFERVEIELAHPGESCRIIRVLDVLEPRYRIDGVNFPGALDGNGLVGEGRTQALKNVAVIETDQTAVRSRDGCRPTAATSRATKSAFSRWRVRSTSTLDRKSTRLNSSHSELSRMPSSA